MLSIHQLVLACKHVTLLTKMDKFILDASVTETLHSVGSYQNQITLIQHTINPKISVGLAKKAHLPHLKWVEVSHQIRHKIAIFDDF